MQFVARIIVEVDADTFESAADHEREIKRSYQDLRKTYPECRLEIKQRRMPRRPPETDLSRKKAEGYTGKLSNYTE